MALGALLVCSALAYERFDARRARPAPRNTPPSASALTAGSPAQEAFSVVPDYAFSIAPQSPNLPPPQSVSPEAVSQLRERLRQKPDDTAARINLAILLDMQGKPSEAEDVLRAALQRGQRSPEIYHAMGMFYFKNKLYSGAAQAFLIQTKLQPDNFEAHLRLGSTLTHLGDAANSSKAFERAIQLDPSRSEPYMGMAFLNNRTERYPYAVKYLQEHIRRAKQPGEGYTLLCRIYLNMRQYDKAVEAGKQAAQASPQNPNAWYNLGQAYAYSPGDQDMPEAAAAFERVLQLIPKAGNAAFELAHVYQRQRRFPEAIAKYREAIAIAPTQGKYHYQLGQLLIQQKQVEEGRKILARAQQLIVLNQKENQLTDKLIVNPNDPRTTYELAQVFQKLEDYPSAARWLEATLQLAPKHPTARAELERVRALARQPGNLPPAS